MEIVKKPDIRVFASEAKTGEIIAFPDVLRGWGVTLDQTQGKPPLEWMNDAFNRIDLNNLYLLQQGIPEWSALIRYPLHSVVKHEGKIYLCTLENENYTPSTSSDRWSLLIKSASEKDAGILKTATQAEVNLGANDTNAVTPKKLAEKLKNLPDATLEQKGLSQLSSTIDPNNVTQPIIGQAVINYFNAQIPAGSTFVWLSETLPDGYFFSRGQAFDKVTNPKLALLFPSGVLPDMRGVVPRGLDAGRGYDPDRLIGSYQEDAMQNIRGALHITTSNSPSGTALGATFGSGVLKSMGRGSSPLAPTSSSAISSNTPYGIEIDASLTNRTADENRMKNIAVNYIIKAG